MDTVLITIDLTMFCCKQRLRGCFMGLKDSLELMDFPIFLSILLKSIEFFTNVFSVERNRVVCNWVRDTRRIMVVTLERRPMGKRNEWLRNERTEWLNFLRFRR